MQYILTQEERDNLVPLVSLDNAKAALEEARKYSNQQTLLAGTIQNQTLIMICVTTAHAQALTKGRIIKRGS